MAKTMDAYAVRLVDYPTLWLSGESLVLRLTDECVYSHETAKSHVSNALASGNKAQLVAVRRVTCLARGDGAKLELVRVWIETGKDLPTGLTVLDGLIFCPHCKKEI